MILGSVHMLWNITNLSWAAYIKNHPDYHDRDKIDICNAVVGNHDIDAILSIWIAWAAYIAWQYPIFYIYWPS